MFFISDTFISNIDEDLIRNNNDLKYQMYRVGYQSYKNLVHHYQQAKK